MNEKDDLNQTLEDIGGTHLGDPVDVTAIGDKERMVLTPEGEKMPLVAYEARQRAGWLDLPNEMVRNQLELRGQNRATLIDWIKANLNEGHDFGVIKGKKSLWKAGAEKIAGMLGLQVAWPDLHDELQRIRIGETRHIFLSCALVRENLIHAQGAGARCVDDDGGDWNKAIKMCKKSAMIDAVLNVGGLSEVFTQDLEDDDLDRATLSESSQDALRAVAVRCFDDKADDVLQSLARRRFHIGDGDWTQIPSFRLADAIRSLEEKAAGGES